MTEFNGGERGIVEFTSCLLPEVTVPMSQLSDNQSLENPAAYRTMFYFVVDYFIYFVSVLQIYTALFDRWTVDIDPWQVCIDFRSKSISLIL